ncbi:hypothetical protein BTO09_07565 [Gilvibacter sp. SZ-19]|uniref:hypothetical protein n=1 Tax=Gilvibacter sp. SZ-19 TaxID=754429 RepID=UPI000B3CC0EE|nr:hypothetical protein [Gilvibacter sp. SZ-19]ARV12218.1 hypothetical protein BTO09_07565 [Gilvibacter sp. SZ-19]
MKFRVLVGLLIVGIIALFSLVVYYSYKITLHEKELEQTNKQLALSNIELNNKIRETDSLKEITQRQYEALANATDSIYFSIAKKNNSFRSYNNYINNIGKDGQYYEAALTNMGTFLKYEGYVQFQESSGRVLYNKFPNTDNLPDTPVLFNGKPSVAKNNLYVATQGWNVRKGVIGNPDFPNTGYTGKILDPGQVIQVLELIESGDAKWAKISFGD